MVPPAIACPRSLSGWLLVCFLLPWNPAPRASRHEEHEVSHQWMVQTLRQIRDRTDVENPWLGQGLAPALRDELAALPREAAPRDRFDLHVHLGIEERRLGRVDAALVQLRSACDLIPVLGEALSRRDQRKARYELAVTHLRRGENANCVGQHCRQSCLFPIEPEGVHADPSGSRAAIPLLTELVRESPRDHGARWLLNIAYMTVGDYPDAVPDDLRIPPERFASAQDFPRFEERSAEYGLDTFSLSGGVVIDDFDNDLDLDIMTSTFDTAGPLHLFENQGEGRFQDRSSAAGLDGLFGGLNMVQADFDNDGFVDVFVLRGAWLGPSGCHPNSLLRNNGDGTFLDITRMAGLADVHCPTQTAAWADIDLDGDLDLFVGNETLGDNKYPCQLFRNNGNGTFTDIASTAGVLNLRYTKGASFGDFDGDRDPDLYVSNLGAANRLYRNEGGGRFVDVASAAGVEGPERSFPTWFWDYDNDGALDLYVSSYWPRLRFIAASAMGLPASGEAARLYRGDGKGQFRDVAREAGLNRLVAPMGANFGDLDSDGYLDFYLGTGYPDFDGLMPNVLYRNLEGRGFADVTTAAGVGHLQKGHGVAMADLDGDFDQDLFEQLGGAFPGDGFRDALFVNPDESGRSVIVKLVGVKSNRSAIGARVRATLREGDQERDVVRFIGSGGSFGAHPLRCFVGLGAAPRIERLEVYWPLTDRTQVFGPVPRGSFIQITEGDSRYLRLN